ncbi:carboxymuconolactone decarboxylase family protein [Streptomyces gamaensis]|uniref:Carboxymuconolactone decarboxylase family protein n=1 Tax=Streptomyces gamaensis TaxID=1763542 RepID=A0ABW0YYQ5_9ACTN
MDPRLNIYENPVSLKFLKYITASYKVFPVLPHPTVELVSLRISQINGCGFCADMHTKEATRAGESAQRLHLVATWREATVFTEAERAALEFAEEGTRIADAAGGVPDDVWARAAKHYDEDQLAALVSLVAFMNLVNRMNVITQQPGGSYEHGWTRQFGG